MRELAQLASPTVRPWFGGRDLGTLVRPHVETEQRPPNGFSIADQDFQSLSCFNRSHEVDRRIENPRRITGLDHPLGRDWKDATQARGLAWDNVHGYPVGAYSCRVYPRHIVLHRVVVHQVARLEVIGRIQ